MLEPAHLPGCLELMLNEKKPQNIVGRCPHLGTTEKWDSLSSPEGNDCKIESNPWNGINWAELAQYLEKPFKPSVVAGTALQPLVLQG